MQRALSFLALSVMLCALTISSDVGAAELAIFAPGSTEGALTALTPQFEQSSGHKLIIKYGPVGVLADRIRSGAIVDVAILSEPASETLQKQGNLVDGSSAVIAKVGIGVFVRKGNPKPDISSVDAFRSALAGAKSIAYADPALGGSTSLLEREVVNSLDGDGSIKAKTKLVAPAKPLLDLVADGGADFGFNPIAEILPDSRVEFVGPIPAPLQKYSRYVASLVAPSQKTGAFRTLIVFLSSPAAVVVMKAKGFEQP